MTDRINEALEMLCKDGDPHAITHQVADLGEAIALHVLLEAARAYVADWQTCPTCNGEGLLRAASIPHDPVSVCPDCVDGMTPSPERLRRAVEWLQADMDSVPNGLWEMSVAMEPEAFVKRLWLASRQGDPA